LTTERAAADGPTLVDGASVVLHLPAGSVPDVASAVRGQVGGRPIVALGGGRVIDAAKAIGAADGLQVAAVPTTLSGAEMTRMHRVLDGAEARGFVRPGLVLGVPALMASQPMPALAASAMNALAHAVEALYTPLANPASEMLALRAAELFAAGLRDARQPNRDELALGALLAAWAMGATGYAVHHVTCQTIVRVAGTPHAQTNAVMLPHSVRFMTMRAGGAIQKLRRALGGDVAELTAKAGPTTLSALGVDADQLDQVVDRLDGRPELDNTPGGAPHRDRLAAFVHAAL
jgi:alcohol dehydrogenase class IV